MLGIEASSCISSCNCISALLSSDTNLTVKKLLVPPSEHYMEFILFNTVLHGLDNRVHLGQKSTLYKI